MLALKTLCAQHWRGQEAPLCTASQPESFTHKAVSIAKRINGLPVPKRLVLHRSKLRASARRSYQKPLSKLGRWARLGCLGKAHLARQCHAPSGSLSGNCMDLATSTRDEKSRHYHSQTGVSLNTALLYLHMIGERQSMNKIQQGD